MSKEQPCTYTETFWHLQLIPAYVNLAIFMKSNEYPEMFQSDDTFNILADYLPPEENKS